MSFVTAYFVEQRKGAAGRNGWVPPLWLLSEGQASESDSPRGEKAQHIIMQVLAKCIFLANV